METYETSSYCLKIYSEKMNPYLLVLNTNDKFSSLIETIMHKLKTIPYTVLQI